MKKNHIKNLLNKKKKGQSLLIVIVISTLTMVVILGMANRIAQSSVALRRTAEFDKSIAIAENRVNSVIKSLDTASVKSCFDKKVTPQTTSLVALDCSGITDQTFLESRVYAQVSPSTAVSITKDVPLTMILSADTNGGITTTGIIAQCSSSTSDQYLFTRIYVDAAGNILSDKGIMQCNDIALKTTSLTAIGNVDLYSTTGGNVTKVAGLTSAITPRTKTLAIRVRALDEAGTNQTTLVDLQIIGDANNDGKPDVVAKTGKYEFLIAGYGQLGSESIITFERPLDNVNSYSPTTFDYAFIGEDN